MAEGSMGSGVLKLCVVYAPEDQQLYAQLEKLLAQLERRLPVELWSAERILAGSERERELAAHLAEADLLVYLLSSDLLVSDYYSEAQLQQLVERYQRGEVQIFSVILRPVVLDLLLPPFDALQPLPEDGESVTKKGHPEAALLEIALNVTETIKVRLGIVVEKAREQRPEGQLWMVPYSRNAYFTGRDEFLATLHARLSFRRGERVGASEALTGLGGLGKTQVALEYAYRYRGDYQAVFWLRADTPENLAADGLALARVLDLPEQGNPEQELVLAALKRWFQRQDGWLLILDNVTELALIERFLPGDYRGHVLMTTRMQATGTVAEPLAVSALAIEEGARWLLRRARLRAEDARSLSQAAEIVSRLDGLPLALDQAAAFLEETGASLEQYLQDYQGHRAALLRYRGQVAAGHPASVGATFALALAEVEQLSERAADLLRICAFLHPATIPEALLIETELEDGQEPLAGASSSYELNTLLKVLLLYSLVRRNSSEHTLSIHALVQAVIRDGLDEQEQRMWAGRVVALVSRAWPERGVSNWGRCQEYLSHALACTELLAHWQLHSLEAVRLLRAVGVYLGERAVYPEAEAQLQQALRLSAELTEPDELLGAGIWHDLGWLAYRWGRYEQAAERYLRALAVREEKLGAGDLQTAQTLSELGLTFVEQRAGERAEPLLQRALETRQRQLGAEHPLVAETLAALGRLARLRGDYEQAETYYRRALAMREKTAGTESLEVAESLSHLGVLFSVQEKYAEAEPFYRSALTIRERALGLEHPETAAVVSRLALALYFQQQYDAAEPLLLRALALQEQRLGRENNETAQTMATLGMLYYRRGDYGRAETLLAEALAVRERILQPLSPDRVTSLNNLSLVYREQQKYDQAHALLLRALTLSEQVHGVEHASTAAIRENLAVLARRADWPAGDDVATG